MGGVKTTAENLREAIEGETHEFKVMYPEFLADAIEEGENQANWSFKVANEVEKIHAGLYRKAAEALDQKRDIPKTEFYVCRVCGNTVENRPPEKCPICGAPTKSFDKVA
jgi:rubrerythrin